MARLYNYCCTQCGNKPHLNNNEARSKLTAKVIQFKQVGYRGKVLHSRVVDWLCESCLEKDEVYNMPERTFIDRVANDETSR